MTIQDFSYTVSSPIVWVVLLLLSLRAVYRCLFTSEEKDYAHAGAFLVVLLGSLYMLGAIYGYLPVPNYFEK